MNVIVIKFQILVNIIVENHYILVVMELNVHLILLWYVFLIYFVIYFLHFLANIIQKILNQKRLQKHIFFVVFAFVANGYFVSSKSSKLISIPHCFHAKSVDTHLNS